MKYAFVSKLASLANELDKQGSHKIASRIDKILRLAMEEFDEKDKWADPGTSSYEYTWTPDGRPTHKALEPPDSFYEDQKLLEGKGPGLEPGMSTKTLALRWCIHNGEAFLNWQGEGWTTVTNKELADYKNKAMDQNIPILEVPFSRVLKDEKKSDRDRYEEELAGGGMDYDPQIANELRYESGYDD